MILFTLLSELTVPLMKYAVPFYFLIWRSSSCWKVLTNLLDLLLSRLTFCFVNIVPIKIAHRFGLAVLNCSQDGRSFIGLRFWLWLIFFVRSCSLVALLSSLVSSCLQSGWCKRKLYGWLIVSWAFLPGVDFHQIHSIYCLQIGIVPRLEQGSFALWLCQAVFRLSAATFTQVLHGYFTLWCGIYQTVIKNVILMGHTADT